MEKNNLVEGKIFPTLMRFAIPFLVAYFLQQLYGAVDLLVVGQFCTPVESSAVSTGSQVMKTITGIVTGLSTGATVLIGQYIGAKRKEDAAKTVGTAIMLFLVVAVVFTGIMLLFSRQTAILMQAPEAALDQTDEYIFICSIGIVFIVGYNAVSGILRGMGDSKSPMIFVIVACIVNIGLDLLFVAVFDMKAAGAALATVIAQALSFLFSLVYLKVKGFGLEVKAKHIRLDRQKTGGILRFGTPVALQEALVNISFLIITAILNSKGLIESAAVGVVEKVICFAMLPTTAMSMAIAAMTAQNIGADRADRAKLCLKYGMLFTLGIAAVIVVFIEVGGGPLLLSIFTKDSQTVSVGFWYLRSYAMDIILVCFIFCMNGFFNGCGKTFFTMAHSLIATFAVRVPLAWLFSVTAGFGMFEMGLAAPIASVCSIVMCFVYFKAGKWRPKFKVNLTEDDLNVATH